jgi:hypothetical protein
MGTLLQCIRNRVHQTTVRMPLAIRSQVASASLRQRPVGEVLSLNEPEDFTFDKVNVYRSPTGRNISFLVDGKDDKWDIVSFGDFASVTNPERSFDKWPISQGRLVSSPKPACIFIDNLKLHQRLIIDHTVVTKPRRSVINLATQERCGCPLIDSCLSPRAE